MGIFDIIGPVMVGPSSSHTAGAVRLGRMARCLLNDQPTRVLLALAGSFAATGEGHGTHEALLGGVLGLDPDDPAIVHAKTLAEEEGLQWEYSQIETGKEHPNTVRINLQGSKGQTITVEGSSVGGGNVRLLTIDGLRVDQDLKLPTLLAAYPDRPGVVAAVTRILAGYRLNIAGMKVRRGARGKAALMTLETDEEIPESALEAVQRLPGMNWTRYVPLLK